MAARPVRPSQDGTVGWPAGLATRYVAEGYWDGRPLTAPLLAAADATPAAVALVDGDRQLTYRELVERADGAAVRLRAVGLRADDRIVVALPNRWEFVVLTLACLRLGVIPVMALVAHRQREISYLADLAEARAIAVPGASTDFDHQAMAGTVARASDTVTQVLVAGGDLRPGNVDLSALCRPAGDPAGARRELDAVAPRGRTVALMLLSGGTTGPPKLIPRSHDEYGCLVRHYAQASRLGPDTAYLAVLPVGHTWPLNSIFATLGSGGRVVLAASPAPERAFPVIQRHGVTVAAVVPAIAQRWLAYRESDPSHDLGSLRVLAVGGSRLSDHVAQRIVPTLAGTLQQAYGMSEGLVCLTRPDDPEPVTHRTQGRLICPGDELRVVDPDGRPVAPGEPGALLARGPCITRGYYRAGEHNARAFADGGWLRTGDLVRQHRDGNVVVAGRDKDLINRGGEKISAEEIENLAHQLDGVRQAAAVAMPDPDLGERVCLYVVAHGAVTVSLAQARAVMTQAGVARFKLPERLIVVDSLPTTSIGKVDKKALRADIGERLAAERVGLLSPAPSI